MRFLRGQFLPSSDAPPAFVSNCVEGTPCSTEPKVKQEEPEAAVVERWHFGMVADYRRNRAYDAAICSAVNSLRLQGSEGMGDSCNAFLASE